MTYVCVYTYRLSIPYLKYLRPEAEILFWTFFFFFQTLDYLHRAQERASLLTQGWHRAHLCFVDTGGVIAYDILYNFVNETKSSWCGMFHLWHHAGAQEVSDLGIL